MYKILVPLKKNKYFIIINKKFSKKTNIFWQIKKNDQVMIITDSNIAPLYLAEIKNFLIYKKSKINTLIIKNGEKYKTLNTLNTIFTKLLKKNYNRKCILIALGGGVIGDIVGLAASIYLRGVRYIQIPTTLLAQVDSSIGGKTAVNHNLGKNMIGSFYQPISVIININYLYTLPKKEISSGLSEIIKYSISFDYKFFSWIEKNIKKILNLNKKYLLYCIKKCCKIKSFIVGIDQYEKNIRSLLNLGHTFGHAIETYTKYKKWTHGESVSAGIIMAGQTSKNLNKLTQKELNRIKKLLKKSLLPIKGPKKMKNYNYIPFMIKDKKSQNKKISLILPKKIGQSKLYFNVSKKIILQSIKETN